jgi:very-short-patch-repair endonuclease
LEKERHINFPPFGKGGRGGILKTKDMIRKDALKEMGIKVLRFSDRDVFENMGGVMEGIWRCL